MTSYSSTKPAQQYVGNELELFASATVWKSYVRSKLQPYLGRSVIEVGAGLGGTTRFLCSGREEKWLCVEPDPQLADQIQSAIAARTLPQCCEVLCGTLATLDRQPRFDTILYIDVLEHIADDAAELRLAADFLAPRGHLVILGPAHQWLFTPFDQAIGHFRRYTKRSLAAAAPPHCRCVKLAYLDSVGLLASCANRVMLNQSMPTVRQITVWDKGMVRCSRVLDRLLGYTVGKSILGVWQKELDTDGK